MLMVHKVGVDCCRYRIYMRAVISLVQSVITVSRDRLLERNLRSSLHDDLHVNHLRSGKTLKIDCNNMRKWYRRLEANSRKMRD